jgi:phosphoglycolate phosphatase-like HAD superfamily hydrolase
MKKIYLDYDGVLANFSNDMFLDINKYFKDNEIINELPMEKIHLYKHILFTFINDNKANQTAINNLFNKINEYFNLEENDINIDNMSRRHQKITKFFKENPDVLNNFTSIVNEYFIKNNITKEVHVDNLSKMNTEIKDFYTNDIGYYGNSNLFKNVVSFLKTLRENGYHITILTANMDEEQKDFKQTHIEKFLIEYVDDIIHTRQKYKYSHDGVFVDDKPSNVKKHIEKNDTEAFILNHTGVISEEDKDIFIPNFSSLLTKLDIKNTLTPDKKNTIK